MARTPLAVGALTPLSFRATEDHLLAPGVFDAQLAAIEARFPRMRLHCRSVCTSTSRRSAGYGTGPASWKPIRWPSFGSGRKRPGRDGPAQQQPLLLSLAQSIGSFVSHIATGFVHFVAG
ncbi:MAG TPA: hypothetical protein VE690_04865, partial [Rhodopila sp.]|nr:hypothetical protein [Rhodopila sp.]